MTYQRVIPRDLFNDANLLKCLGQLYLELERLNIPGVELEHWPDTRAFIIHQNEDDGSTYCRNVVLTVKNKHHYLTRPLNSRKSWPLYLNEIPIFDNEGCLTEEFKAFVKPGSHWLDKHIDEQAAYYGQTTEKFSSFMSDMAEAQEDHERNDP